MSKKRILAGVFTVCVMILINVLIVNYKAPVDNYDVTVKVTMTSDKQNGIQLFYLEKGSQLENGFNPTDSLIANYKYADKEQILEYTIPADVTYLRLDMGEGESVSSISKMQLQIKDSIITIETDSLLATEDVQNLTIESGDGTVITATGLDPYVVWDTSNWGIAEMVRESCATGTLILKAVMLIVIDAIFLIVLKLFNRLITIPIELWHNRKLIMQLAKNDFKTKYSGSYLGIIWAFIQPIITVLVYWFVFEKGLRAGAQNTRAGIEVPFVLWLVAGLVPWFFFQDALSGGTTALIEYSYLVKKVVFKISILPIVKVISALFVHLFFIAFTLILYVGYQYYPDIYTLQILYYSVAMLLFVLGITYATSAIVIFFRDLTQIIAIVIQVGVWMTPIMWNIDTMELSPVLLQIFKLNPMYYIVAGYRDSLINKVAFWENPGLTIYFWIVTVLVFGIGTLIFKRLKVHFADVL